MIVNRRRPARRGFALMLVMVSTTLVLSSWALANRRTSALLRLRQAHVNRLAGMFGTIAETHLADPAPEALAYAAALLETGDPTLDHDPESGLPEPYLCRKSCLDASGKAIEFVVRFTPDPNVEGRWTIEAIPKDLWQGDPENPPLDDIPAMPGSF